MDDGVVRDMTVLRALSWNWASRTSVFDAYWAGTEVYNKFANVHVHANRFCNDYYQYMFLPRYILTQTIFTHTFVHCSCCDMWKIKLIHRLITVGLYPHPNMHFDVQPCYPHLYHFDTGNGGQNCVICFWFYILQICNDHRCFHLWGYRSVFRIIPREI